MWHTSLQAAQQSVEVVGVARNRHIVRDVIHSQPDRDQVRMRIERYRQFKPQRTMHHSARYAQVDQAKSVAELHSQVGCPTLCVWVIGTQSKGVRGSNSYIREFALRALIASATPACRSGIRSCAATARKKQQEEE